MGIRMYLTRLPQARLDSVRTDPAAWGTLDADYEDLRENLSLKAIGGNDTLGFGDLDKAYEALYFFFDPARRTVDHSDVEPTTPAGAAVWGWHQMHAEFPYLHDDAVYSPRYNTAAEVAEIAAVLNTLDFDTAFADHASTLYQYPWHYKVFDLNGHDNFLRQRFEILRDLYAEAAQHNHAVIAQLH